MLIIFLKKTSTYFEFIFGILIPLLVFTPVFISGGLIIDMLTEEYERKTMDLLLVTPVSFSQIVNGKMITAIIIVPAQAFLWLLLVRLNGVSCLQHWIHILLLSGIIAAIVVIIGAIIAVKYKKRMISQYLYSLVLILMFLAGYLFTNSPFNLVTRLGSRFYRSRGACLLRGVCGGCNCALCGYDEISDFRVRYNHIFKNISIDYDDPG